jgi:hypothetical protein
MGEEVEKVNVFRPKYRELNEREKQMMEAIKVKAQELWDMFDDIATPNNGREVALAKTHLEDSVMRAVKGLTA